MTKLRQLFNTVPPVVRSFILRAAIIFVVWQVLYIYVLQPPRIPDRFLSNITGMASGRILSLFYDNIYVIPANANDVRCALIMSGSRRIIGVADPCNGLDLYVLYLSFLFCFPGTWRRRLAFIAVGLPYIFIINAIRCALIAWLNIEHPRWVDISHHYIFTAIVYLLVFFLWNLYTRRATNEK